MRGLDHLWALELVTDRQTKTKAYDAAEQIMYGCLQDGLNFKVSQDSELKSLLHKLYRVLFLLEIG